MSNTMDDARAEIEDDKRQRAAENAAVHELARVVNLAAVSHGSEPRLRELAHELADLASLIIPGRGFPKEGMLVRVAKIAAEVVTALHQPPR